MPALNFLTICNKLRPINSTNLSILKILATHRLKVSKLQLAFQEIYQFLIQNNQFSVSAKFFSHFQKNHIRSIIFSPLQVNVARTIGILPTTPTIPMTVGLRGCLLKNIKKEDKTELRKRFWLILDSAQNKERTQRIQNQCIS